MHARIVSFQNGFTRGLALAGALLLLPGLAAAQDTDGDTVLDINDNCILSPNLFQLDTDCDGFGDACDADFNNDLAVNLTDYGIFQASGLGTPNSLYDVAPPFDGVSDPVDEAAVLAAIGNPPGPSAMSGLVSPSCGPRYLPGTAFCVQGVSTGAAYALELTGPGVTTLTLPVLAGAPVGAGADTLMLQLQSHIDQGSGTSGVTVTDVSLTPAACFTLSNPAAVLSVGPSGAPQQCTVTSTGCQYNPLVYQGTPTLTDSDGDGIPDATDTCTFVPDRLQLDTDCDGFGDACDADFDNDLIVSLTDLNIFNGFGLGAANQLLDIAPPFNGVTDAADQAAVTAAMGLAPGSSAPPGAQSSPSCGLVTLPSPHFCVNGTANGTNYAWSLISSIGNTAVKDPVIAVPPGSGAGTLMMNFQASVDAEQATTGVSVTQVALTPAACFGLSDPGSFLTVGPAGNPTQCTVTPAGCSFNPTIYQVLAAVPVLSPAPLVALATLLCGVTATVIARRQRGRS